MTRRQWYAYVNHGRWVADCPADECLSAELLMPGTTTVLCGECGNHGPVKWPPPETVADIGEVLSRRPIVADRNWFPQGHPWAADRGFPVGQSRTELLAENDEVARRRAEQNAAARTPLDAAAEAVRTGRLTLSEGK